jgi:hypothetical protein
MVSENVGNAGNGNAKSLHYKLFWRSAFPVIYAFPKVW